MKEDKVLQAEINIAYLLSLTLDKMLMDAERRMTAQRIVFRRDKKQSFNKIIDGIQRTFKACAELNEDIELESAPSGYTDLDDWNRSANETVRLLLLFSDKCWKSDDNANCVFKYLRSLDGEGVITEEALERFYMKK